MKISSFDIFLLQVPLGGQIYNPRVRWHRKQSVLLRLTDKEGQVGWGECWCFDESADTLIRFLQTEIKPSVLGRTIDSVSSLWSEVWANTSLNGRHGLTAASLSGVDIALYDLLSKARGVSLGSAIEEGPIRNDVPVYGSGGLYRINDSLDRLAAEMSGMVEQGHNRVKMKFGALPFIQDVERLRTVRQAIGPKTKLIADAVYSLDSTKARDWLPIWEEVGVEAIQAPFPVQDWASMTWLNRDCGIPVMVFETESRIEIFRALLQQEAIGVLQFSPIAAGGITAAKKLIKLGQEFGVPVSLQCSSTWLAEAVALELARGHEYVAHVELHTLHQGLFECVSEKERSPVKGSLKLHDRTGLGFVPSISALTEVNNHLPDLTAGFFVQNQ
ncbi:mandelate racemase/muconate lactonizing enzyme family protein [Amphritea sp.]|uniref:mandelate racemase/muconate lactonizing enzyme family protein n=1 Tax=Amphritea sp. TaxID=1872502 RepID=UPI003A951E64